MLRRAHFERLCGNLAVPTHYLEKKKKTPGLLSGLWHGEEFTHFLAAKPTAHI